jgi:hypothetical protein
VDADDEGEGEEAIHGTFPGTARAGLSHLPNEYGQRFPAYMTHKSAVDFEIIDEMRSVYVKGVRPAGYSDMLLEWHSKQYTRDFIQREAELAIARGLGPVSPSEFSAFSDPTGYNGTVPTGIYLAHVYKQYMKEIKPHFDREVKKRGAERLHWDASYKVAKHLSQYHGHSIFKVTFCLGSVRCGCRSVRRPFHTLTPTSSPTPFPRRSRPFCGTGANHGNKRVRRDSTAVPRRD